jgi:3-oxo-5-alpha-steroid 4-dehydrogenase 1
MFEGILTLLVSLPVIFTNYYYSEGLNWLDNLGLTIWSFGFVMETVSDLHLLIFKNRAEDGENVLTEGLWKYSRHPNYFGESLVWCGLFIISLSVTHGVYTLVSPVLVIFLLLYVSGVPLLEKRYQNNENYQKYSKKTSKFLPKPLKNKII